MTTAAPPCAPVTPSPGPLRAERAPERAGQLVGRPAYPVLNTGVWRGGRRPPSEPPASRAAAGASSGRGLLPPNPQTGALSRRSGAPPWSPASSTRTRPSSASRRPSGSPPSGSGPTRPSAASERAGSPLRSASRITRRAKTWRTAASTRQRAGSSPSRRDTSRRRRGLGVTRTREEGWANATRRRAAFPVEMGGSLPAPPSRRKAGGRQAPEGTEPQRRQRDSGEVRGPTQSGIWGPTRSVCVGPWRSDPGKALPGTVHLSAAALRSASSRGAIRHAVDARAGAVALRFPLGDPPPRSSSRASSSPWWSWPSRSRRAAPPFQGPIRSRRCPDRRAWRSPTRRPVRSVVAGVPAATPFDSGLPGVADVSPDVVLTFGDRVQVQDKTVGYATAIAERSTARAG